MPKVQKSKYPVQYKTGTPEHVGVYACRVPMGFQEHLVEDRFLTWSYGKWWYLSSSAQYRGAVIGWIGPLPRTNA